jgi:DNA mismatch endonuclease, patch repair protein
MADNMSPKQRSYTMSRIRSRRNQSTEERLARAFRRHGIKGWRRHTKLPGRPDFIFRKEKVAVFVDGCFWHGCPRCKLKPKSNIDYWDNKIRENKSRDRRDKALLQQRGWAVVRLWEHSLKNSDIAAGKIKKILSKNGESVTICRGGGFRGTLGRC